tara:strand:+ start:402 stop:1568 length:1167 start_codon:yes stop_codon:yes gene_type:complete
MNLSDLIIKEQEVDMGQRPGSGPGQEGNPVPSGEKDFSGKDRQALNLILGDQQEVSEVIRAMDFMKQGRGVPANFARSLYNLIMKSIGVQIQLGIAQTKRGQELVKQQSRTGAGGKQRGIGDNSGNVPELDDQLGKLQGESIQEEITGQDRVAIKQIVPDNQKVNDIIRAMARIQQGKNPPTDTIPAINELIQNSIGIQIQLGTAQTKRGQDMVKQQAKAGGVDKQPAPSQPSQPRQPRPQPSQPSQPSLPSPPGKPSKVEPLPLLNNSKQYESMAYAMPSQDEESERVTYSKTKKQGDSSVTVSANADSMDELHNILRLAGIDFEKSGEVDHTPDHKDHDDHEEPESDHGEHGKDKVMVISPADASMSTDKEVLTNYLKDKLRKSIS